MPKDKVREWMMTELLNKIGQQAQIAAQTLAQVPTSTKNRSAARNG